VTKRYDEPIEVMPDPLAGGPLSFRWRGRRYEIDQRLDSWLETTHNGASNGVRAGNRHYFRVLAHPAEMLATGDLDADGFMTTTCAVYDVYLDRDRRIWRLARLWD
jgi:Family of unknown function (DUF6504)